MKKIINLKNGKACAFCKYWFDPSSQHITPHHGDYWKYEDKVKCRCILKNLDKESCCFCSSYVSKI